MQRKFFMQEMTVRGHNNFSFTNHYDYETYAFLKVDGRKISQVKNCVEGIFELLLRQVNVNVVSQTKKISS